ncbi:alpha/beta fold hydrolase [Ruegeria jejuensis]|uniref:alpha/beta fold hydrolase n=1 Tax=Ruegeria jejuensis TaxID=3233338 RepID=UPI00355B5632
MTVRAHFFASSAENPDVRAQITGVVTADRLGGTFGAAVAARSAKSVTQSAIAGYLKAWTEEDASTSVGAYQGPVKVCVGEHDPFLTEQVSRDHIMAIYPGADFESLSGAGHYPPLETPPHTAAVFNAFFGSQTI